MKTYHKVVLIGGRQCGKTCILDQLMNGLDAGYQKPHYEPTIEDIYSLNVDNDRGFKERIHFVDTCQLIPPLNVEQIKMYLSFADVSIIQQEC